MATYESVTLGARVLTITSHMTVDLACKPYAEYRLEERDADGTFIGYAAMGSYGFVKDAMRRRAEEHVAAVMAALKSIEPNPEPEPDDDPEAAAYGRLMTHAREIGEQRGTDAASRYFDGNTSEDTYRHVLDGIRDCDPAVYDTFPSNPLSGEWADSYLPRDLANELGLAADAINDDLIADACTQFEDAYDVAVSREIERQCRLHAWTADTTDDRYGLNGVAWYVTEWSPDRSQVHAVMIGDDRVHTLDTADLTRIADNDYCTECGQLGCKGDGRD